MLREVCGGIAKRVTRFLKPRSAAKDTAYAVGRIGEVVLEPGIKGALHQVCRLVLGGDLEKWVNP